MEIEPKVRIGVELTLLEEILGTKPGNEELLRTYVAGKAPDARSLEEELTERDVDDVIEERMTGFDKEDGHPFIWDYQLKGFLKDSWKALKAMQGTECSKVKAYKQKIDGAIFLAPENRRMFFENADGTRVSMGQMGKCERPLRAQTMQGERVSIAKSEAVPAGSVLRFTVEIFEQGLEKCVRECLDYGSRRGLGQWRNSGKGRFEWREV